MYNNKIASPTCLELQELLEQWIYRHWEAENVQLGVSVVQFEFDWEKDPFGPPLHSSTRGFDLLLFYIDWVCACFPIMSFCLFFWFLFFPCPFLITINKTTVDYREISFQAKIINLNSSPPPATYHCNIDTYQNKYIGLYCSTITTTVIIYEATIGTMQSEGIAKNVVGGGANLWISFWLKLSPIHLIIICDGSVVLLGSSLIPLIMMLLIKYEKSVLKTVPKEFKKNCKSFVTFPWMAIL